VRKGDKSAEVLVVTRNGYGKTTPVDEYKSPKPRRQRHQDGESHSKTGQLIAARVVSKNTEDAPEIVVVSKKGQVIRTDLSEIPSLSRGTQGVRVMKLRDGPNRLRVFVNL
jgi:DNA gyrase subunit A